MDNRNYNKGKNNFKPPKKELEQLYLVKVEEIFEKNYPSLILNDEKRDYNSYIDKIKEFAKNYKDDISTSQLRNVFVNVKQSSVPNDIHILRPKFAYISGRTDSKKEGLKILLFLLETTAKEVKSDKQVEEFKNFFEAIISYHKYYGGKE